jgi:hypothetical protein
MIVSCPSGPLIAVKLPEINHLMKGKSYFGSQFCTFQTMAGWPIYCKPVARQYTVWEQIREETTHLTVTRKQKRERRVSHWCTNIPFKGMSPVTSLPSSSIMILSFPTSQKFHRLETKPSIHGSLGDIQYSNYDTCSSFKNTLLLILE